MVNEMVQINNARVHTGYITFIHAKAIDQENKTFMELPGANEQYTSLGTFCKMYELNERTTLFLW